MREALCENNPCIGTNDPDKGSQPRERVLSDAEIKLVWRSCGNDDFGRLVRLLLLSGCRREEIGRLQWSEVDTGTGVLTIPAERVKNNRTLTLPLPRIAIDLLPPMRAGRSFVFGERGQGFSAWGYGKLHLDARIGIAPWVLHDLRRTMRTGLGKIGVAPHIAELVINHTRGGIQAVYDKHRYEPEIRAALAKWAEHVAAVVG
jgi:integrase